MDISIRVIVAASTITFTSYLHGMQGQDAPSKTALKVYAVPGLGGDRDDDKVKNEAYVKMLFEVKDGDTAVDITHIITPREYADLGQEKCMDYVERAIEEDQKKDAKAGKRYDRAVLFASSQGAATIVNLMGQKKLKIPNLKGIIFEGLFLSANDALHHSIHGARSESYGFLKGLPGLPYWLPLCAQILKFPHYRPGGLQPIHAVQDIPKELPMVIIHGQKDQRVSHDDAELLSKLLRSQGNNHVYFMSKQSGDDAIEQERDHVTVLDQQQDVPTLHAILRKHGILPTQQGAGDADEAMLAPLQPTTDNLQHYLALYKSKLDQHTIHERIEQGMDAAAIAAGIAVTYWALKSMLEGDAVLSESAMDQGFILSSVLAGLE